VSEPLPSFGARFALAWRILFDAAFAARVTGVSEPALPSLPEPEPEPEPVAKERREQPPNLEPALQLLGLLQREGRFVDFLKQELGGFGDAQIGAAARVVHEGCRRAVAEHLTIAPIRGEAEGAQVTVDVGYEAAAVKLTGNVKGNAPYRGVLRHRGWRAESIQLPRAVGDHDARVLAPAEIEL
jgi:Domain of unknown function (DUF2760)